MIPTLIKEQDNFEIIRGLIASVLVSEITNQKALAIAASKDPALWSLRVYSERASAFEQWLEITDSTDFTPFCNIWFDSASYTHNVSNNVDRQFSESTYNIDCYGYGQSCSNGAGHLPGDMLAAQNVHRSIKLIRNILMASEHRYLGLQRTVSNRWITNATVFQPEFDGRVLQNIVAARVVFVVRHNEFSPGVSEETLERINLVCKTSPEGEVLFNADYEF